MGLKKLTYDDLISLKGNDDETIITTKQQTANIIRTFIKEEIINAGDEFIEKEKYELVQKINEEFKKNEKIIETRIKDFEKNAIAFIEYKIDLLSEKICGMLVTRIFDKEVNKKVDEVLKKVKKGKF